MTKLNFPRDVSEKFFSSPSVKQKKWKKQLLMHFKIQFQGGFVYWLPVLAYETKTREFFLNMVKYHRKQNLQYGLAFRFLPNKLENDSGEGINLIDIPKAWWWEPRELLSCLTAISAFEEGLQEGTPSEKGRPWTTSAIQGLLTRFPTSFRACCLTNAKSDAVC